MEFYTVVHNFDSRINLSNHSLYEIPPPPPPPQVLSKYFSNIERMDYHDSLEITESKPLIDYIMSCHGNQNEILGPRLNEFKEYIEELLKNNGKIVVTKQAGLFVCKN